MRLLLLSVVGFSVLLGGCQSTDPYAFEQKNQQQAEYEPNLMTRHVLGLSKKDQSIPRTAPIGGLSEANGDHYMKQQAEALQTELGDSGVSVDHKGNEIHLVMPGNITFGSDSHELQPTFLPILDAVARVLMHFDQTLLEVAGYTDSRGKETYNKQLSELRAEVVANYLINYGITEPRIESKGMGESNPVASNKTKEGQAKNRRVELKISAIK